MRTPLMTGAALMLLAGAASPAMAGHSTASEREATRQLNLQAAEQARGPVTAQPQQAQPQVADATIGMPANSPPAAAPTAKVQTAAAEPVTSAPAALSQISNPPAKVGVANVQDSSGTIIGAVQRVEVTPQGQPTKVAVALIGKDEKMVVLDADKVTYDQGSNVITAQGSADQIRNKAG